MKPARLLTITSLFVILLVSHHSVSARLLPTNQGGSSETQEDDISDLKGWEECNNTDEECINRRMLADAHLDYIYTQRHKSKP